LNERKKTNTEKGPYSKFRVGACILTKSGEFITGANVENASYPVGTCAERVAFGTAVVCLLFYQFLYFYFLWWDFNLVQVAGHKEFKALAVATDISPPASPCGMCRQL
jgi:cytidine deaminase